MSVVVLRLSVRLMFHAENCRVLIATADAAVTTNYANRKSARKIAQDISRKGFR